MSAERTVLRINPEINVDESDDGILLPTTTSVKVYGSWQDVIKQAHGASPGRQIIVIELEATSGSQDRQLTNTGRHDHSAETNDQDIDHDPFEAPFSPSHNGGKINQQLVRSVYLEFRRVNQEVSVDRQIGSFDQRLQSLSARELDVLILIVQGRTCKEVAAKLTVGLATAAKHRAKIFKKLCVRNSIELMHLLSAFFVHS